MDEDFTVANLTSALKELSLQIPPLTPWVNVNTMHVTVRKDQNGVVWCGPGVMDRSAYESLLDRAVKCGIVGLPSYDALPVWDSHAQSIVEVD